MRIKTRTVALRDLEYCLPLLKDRAGIGESDKALILDLWRRRLIDGSMPNAVVEDLDRPREFRIVGFGASVFVTDRMLNRIKDGPPYLSATIARFEKDSPEDVLNLAEIRRCNSTEGLNLVVPFSGAADYQPGEKYNEQLAQQRQALIHAFFETHQGYRLNEILVPALGEGDMAAHISIGTIPRTNRYELYFRNHGMEPPPSDRYPYLLGLTREEAKGNWGAWMSTLFWFRPPCFGFSPPQQQLLARALFGETDEELAASLGVTPAAVKKRWNTIYEQVAAIQPDLLPAAEQGKRGQQKRHHLLGYLREHREELRPILLDQRAAAGR